MDWGITLKFALIAVLLLLAISLGKSMGQFKTMLKTRQAASRYDMILDYLIATASPGTFPGRGERHAPLRSAGRRPEVMQAYYKAEAEKYIERLEMDGLFSDLDLIRRFMEDPSQENYHPARDALQQLLDHGGKE